MPRYFFHLHNDVDAFDEEGTELPDLEAAMAHANKQARATFAETAKDEGRVALSHRIDIADESGAIVGTVRFDEAVQVDQ